MNVELYNFHTTVPKLPGLGEESETPMESRMRVGILTGDPRARPDLKHLRETPNGNGLATNKAPLRHCGP